MEKTIQRVNSSEDFRDLERRINQRLKAIDRRYAISNLMRAPDGKYRFEMRVAIDPRHQKVLHAVLREVLRELPADRQVQAKFYLPESVAGQVKEVAARRTMSQSALVAECLRRYLSA